MHLPVSRPKESRLGSTQYAKRVHPAPKLVVEPPERDALEVPSPAAAASCAPRVTRDAYMHQCIWLLYSVTRRCSCSLGRQVFNLKAHVDLTKHALSLAPPSPSHAAVAVEVTPAQQNALDLAGVTCDV